MPEPVITEIIQTYRDEIEANEKYALRYLTYNWMDVEKGLESDISALTAEIERRMVSGEVVTQQMLWKMDSYKRTLSNMEELIGEYNGVASPYISGLREKAYMMGVNKANEVLIAELATKGLLPPAWERFNEGAVKAALGALSDKSPWIQSLYDAYGDSAAGFSSAVVNGIARGQSAVQMAAGIRDGVGMGLNRSLLCAQTEMGRAYRSGTVDQYRKSGVVEYYVRLVKKSTACLACLVLDGEKYELEEDMQDHPRGFCDVIAKVQGVPLPQWEKGRGWLAKQDDATQIQIMGKTRHDMWVKSGKSPMRLDDYIHKVDDPIWGKQPAIRSLKNTAGYDDYIAKKAAAKTAVERAKYNEMASMAKQLEMKNAAFEKSINGTIKDIARKNGGVLEGLDYRVKTQSSILRNMEEDMRVHGVSLQDAANSIDDGVRYTMTFNSDEWTQGVDYVFRDMRKRGFTPYHMKNNMGGVNTPYHGLNTRWQDKDGNIFELQFHTPESFAIKMKNHDLYDQWIKSTNRAEKMRLEKLMVKEWEDFVPPWNYEYIDTFFMEARIQSGFAQSLGTLSTKEIANARAVSAWARTKEFFTHDLSKHPTGMMERNAKDTICKDLVELLKDVPGMDYDTIDELIHTWAVSSNDSNIVALRLQERASKIFNTPFTEWQRLNLEDAKLDWVTRGVGAPAWQNVSDYQMDRFLQAMYANTQDYLSAQGINELVLYRGVNVGRMSGVARQRMEKMLLNGDMNHVLMESNAMSSWSVLQSEAQSFAGGSLGYVIEALIPAKNVVGSALTGFGCLGEAELVVLGNNADVGHIVWRVINGSVKT